MGLFGTKKKYQLPALMTAADFDEIANYDSALAYLVGLSDEDYGKVIKVAEINRKAWQDSCDVLGNVNEPSTFITPPEQAPGTFLDEPDFLEDDKPAVDSVSKKSRQIKVKD